MYAVYSSMQPGVPNTLYRSSLQNRSPQHHVHEQKLANDFDDHQHHHHHHHQHQIPSQSILVNVKRSDANQAWGFRIQGGADYYAKLSVKKVVTDGPANGILRSGDHIISINTEKTRSLTHAQIIQLIKSSGNEMNLEIIRSEVLDMEKVRPVNLIKFVEQ